MRRRVKQPKNSKVFNFTGTFIFIPRHHLDLSGRGSSNICCAQVRQNLAGRIRKLKKQQEDGNNYAILRHVGY